MADLVDDGLTPESETILSSAEIVPGAFIGDPSKVVTARGTEDGLILRIDGRADWSLILGDIESFLGGRRKFFEGGEVSVEWLERLPTKEQSKELEDLLRGQYGIEIVTRRKRPPETRQGNGRISDQSRQSRSSGAPAI